MANLRIEIKWAIYFAGMTLAWMALEKMSGLHGKYIDYHLYLTNLFALPAIWFMVLALQDKKKNFFHGRMSYRQGLISGILLSAFIALLSPLTQWIITYVITPDYFQTVIKRSVEIGYYPTTEAAAAQFNYKNYAINSTLFAFVFGAITIAIAMIFIQTKNEQR
jgi:hypothetical protein